MPNCSLEFHIHFPLDILYVVCMSIAQISFDVNIVLSAPVDVFLRRFLINGFLILFYKQLYA